MKKLTASNLVSFIDQLDRNAAYNYVYTGNKGLIEVVSVVKPEGPITIKRYNPSKGTSSASAVHETISKEMIWRIANAIKTNLPINFDRILGGSYNTRSVLEALLAHTPQFYFCYPGRIERIGDREEVKDGHKHLTWRPEHPHEIGVLEEYVTDSVVSEIPSAEVVYEALVIPDSSSGTSELDIKTERRHAQIQIALYHIGLQLGYRTWIAQNDKGILYNQKRICEYDQVISTLEDENLIKAHEDAIRAAVMIDCIWFKNGRLMPAVMEIEHSTGVTSGLTRMKNFYDHFPPFPTRYAIVAPDELRSKVLQECNKPQFAEMSPKYFPYSAVEELYSLCQRRKIAGVTEEFLNCFMEDALESSVVEVH